MTRKEWMKEHYPHLVQDHFLGGVQACPDVYSNLMLADKSVSRAPTTCLKYLGELDIRTLCERCWNQEMEVSQ